MLPPFSRVALCWFAPAVASIRPAPLLERLSLKVGLNWVRGRKLSRGAVALVRVVRMDAVRPPTKGPLTFSSSCARCRSSCFLRLLKSKKTSNPIAKTPPKTPMAIPAFTPGLVSEVEGLADGVELDDAAASVALSESVVETPEENCVCGFNVVLLANASVDSPLRLIDFEGVKDSGRLSVASLVSALGAEVSLGSWDSLAEAAVTSPPELAFLVVSAGTPTVV